jgi:hypothetical protein
LKETERLRDMKSGFRTAEGKSGFILVSVLLSATMLLTAATAFAWFAKNESVRASQALFIAEARSVADVVCRSVIAMIDEDTNGFDSHIEPLYSKRRPIKAKIGNFNATVTVQPLDDKIPLSGIFLPDGVTLRNEYANAWTRIWELVKAPELEAEVLDFMDSDDAQKLGGGEREGNINRVVTDLAELKAVEGVDDEILYGGEDHPNGIASYLTVWGGAKVNVNVAQPEVIALLDDAIGLDHAKRLSAAAALAPLESLDSIKKLPGFPAASVTKLSGVIGFKSTYFRLSIELSDNKGRKRSYRVIIKRGALPSSVVRWEE